MNKSSKNKIRLGIFVSLGILLFIVGVYLIGERQQLFRSTFRLSGIFTDVAGLQTGSNVRLSGVTVGTIDNISIISDTLVKVEIVIDDDVRKFIKQDAVASIGSDGLMGNKVLIINPGTGGKEQMEDNATIATVQPLSFDDIIVSLKITADNASRITNDLASIADQIQSGKGTVGRLLMDQSMARNFDSSMVSLKQGANQLRRLIDEVRGGFIQNLDSTALNFKESSVEIKILLEKAKKSWMLWGFK